MEKAKKFVTYFCDNYATPKYILSSLYITLVLCLTYNPLSHNAISNFNRYIGNSSLVGVSVGNRIDNFYFYLFFLIPVTFVFLYVITCLLCKKNTENSNEAISFLNTVSSVALIPLIISYFNRYSGTSEVIFNFAIVLPFIWIVTIIFEIKLSSIFKHIFDFRKLKFSIFASLPIFLFVSMILFKINITHNYKIWITTYLILITIFYVLISFIFKSNSISNMFKYVEISFMPVMIAPIIMYIMLEGCNILNQYSIFINCKIIWSLIIYIIAFILSTIIYLYCKNKRVTNNFQMEKWYYPIIIITLAIIIAQIPMQTTVNTDLFESANHGMAISEFYNFGKLPIIQTFDAHMFSNQIWGYIYGLINHDMFGAIFTPYASYAYLLFLLIMFFLLKKMINEDTALLICLLYPLTYPITYQISVFYFGLILILVQIRAYKMPSNAHYILYWLTIIMVCLWALDVGFAFSLASLLAWLVISFLGSRKMQIIKLISSGLYAVAIFSVLFMILCLFKSVNPIDRIHEFVALTLSNENWGYSSLGNPAMAIFATCYILLPLCSLCTYIYIISKKAIDKDSINDTQLIILSMLFGAYFFNISRGLVRHSLLENDISIVAFTAPLFLAYAIYIITSKRQILTFIGSYFGITLILCAMLSTQNPPTIFSLDQALSKHLEFKPYSSIYTQRVNRILLSEDMKNISEPMKILFDKIMTSQETYIDFTNQSLLYALTGRDKPVYVNQSPGLLSGDYTQKMFIKESEYNKNETTFALMPLKEMKLSDNLDGVQNAFRYYLISEYISINFKPLISYNGFVIWCRNDKYNEKERLINELILNSKGRTIDTNLTNIDLDSINRYDINSLLNENNQLVINSGSYDPQITNIQSLINMYSIFPKARYVEVMIQYLSNVGGDCQLFFTTENGENFSGNKVRTQKVNKSGTLSFIVPISAYTKLRFDPPNNSIFIIQKLSVKPIYDLNMGNITFTNYNYGLNTRLHIYELGQIPYLWGQYDSKHAANNAVILNLKSGGNLIANASQIFHLDPSTINKQSGNYILISGKATGSGDINLELGNQSTDGFNTVSKYSFQTEEGNNMKYLVRVSSDFMWYADVVKLLRITSNINIERLNICVLKGD